MPVLRTTSSTSRTSIGRLSRKAIRTGGGFRLTYQASERNKFAISYDYQTSCACQQVGLASVGWGAGQLATPEASVDSSYPDVYAGTVTWTNPVSNRLLLEAGFMAKLEKNGASGPRPPAGDPALDLIGVIDFGTGFASHGRMPTVFSTYSAVRLYQGPAPQETGAGPFVSPAGDRLGPPPHPRTEHRTQ